MDNIDIDFNSLDDGIIDDLYNDVLETGTFLARTKCYQASFSYGGGDIAYCSFMYCEADENGYRIYGTCNWTPTQRISAYNIYYYCSCPYEG